MASSVKVKGTNIPDMVGRVFGRLTVVKNIASRKRQSFWECNCICGNAKNASGKNLRAGNILSCGCLRIEITKKIRRQEAISRYGQSTKKSVLNNYITNAKRNDRIFNVSAETFFALTQMPCYYCGSLPSNIQRNNCNNGDYKYNGLDRLDNKLGYESFNVVPCCKTCNLAKHVMTEKQFKEWISKVYNHLIKIQNNGPGIYEE